ncbi:hypothetical protein LPC27_04750 [Paraclostridium bifermentans]|uniref:hypothetical protein n=1 Tax=Paraclostridium bifermentans TaxID=1490 RepID=UPI001F1F3A6C|nr:hypothetical protein [Paraclostridium bifermentans]MCE9675064.1 hypothetical protein [Paraclostridium bifermentans]MCR1874360.1 hypothetical protein [Paraclostridium bifermentans]
MSFTYELFFQIFNTILIIAIPIVIYKLIKKVISNKRLVNERLTSIEEKIDNLK